MASTVKAGSSARFADWLTKYGIHKVAAALGVKPSTVYGWRRYAQGKNGGNRPDPRYLGALLSLGCGAFTTNDVYVEQVRVRR